MAKTAPRTNLPLQAAKLTLGVWIFTFILFLMPVVASKGELPPFSIGMTALVVAIGMVLTVPLYWVCARLQDSPTALKVGGVFAAVCVTAFAFSVSDALFGANIIQMFMGEHQIPPDVINRTVSNFISFSWLYGWLGTTYVILQTNAAMRERDLQLAEARTLAQTAQLTALRLQLNPHFLFNTLNAISSLIVTGRNRDGEAMLAKLCVFLRTALVARRSQRGQPGRRAGDPSDLSRDRVDPLRRPPHRRVRRPRRRCSNIRCPVSSSSRSSRMR